MLTLKAPVQLHIAQRLTGNAEAFSERIRGNYGLIGSRYTPKDLLFLLTAPPELPEELGGMTTLVTQNSNVDVRTVTMDVVNHVVNRILLDGTQQFTYQDQVYITSVLNRLGVTNVSAFMEQVRQLRTENESTVRLTQMYREKLKEILQREREGEQAPSLPIPPQGDEEAAEKSQDPRVTMCLDILQRLDTTNLFETIYKFQHNWMGGATNIHHNELRMAEQLRFSNAVSLSEIKQQIYQRPQLHLLHHLNQYEAGLLMEAPRDEEAVLSQAAVAALVNAVDNTVVAVLNRPSLRQEQWVHIENAIWQTAENTLSRFETYHSQYSLLNRAQTPAVQAAWKYVEQELNEYQYLYQSIYPKAEEYGRSVFESYYGTNVQMTHLEQLEEEEVRLQEEHRHFHTESQRTVLLPEPKPVEPVTMTLREVEEHAPEILVEELTRIDQQNRTVLQNIQASMQQRETPAPQGADVQRTMQDALRALEEPGAVLQEIFAQQEAKMVHPDYSPQEEAILQQADPASRVLYEKIFAYQKDPEGALAHGLVRPGNMGALQAQLQQVMQDEPLSLEHLKVPESAEQEVYAENSGAILEKLRQMPEKRRTVQPIREVAQTINFVHKQVAADVTQELLEQLEQQRTKSTVTTVNDEIVTQRQIHQVDVKQVEHKVVTQTTEDITELVNRTLARQMRTISDQVYRQMEKRLQSERSRRGRL